MAVPPEETSSLTVLIAVALNIENPAVMTEGLSNTAVPRLYQTEMDRTLQSKAASEQC
jgi:hypothetical protein